MYTHHLPYFSPLACMSLFQAFYLDTLLTTAFIQVKDVCLDLLNLLVFAVYLVFNDFRNCANNMRRLIFERAQNTRLHR